MVYKNKNDKRHWISKSSERHLLKIHGLVRRIANSSAVLLSSAASANAARVSEPSHGPMALSVKGVRATVDVPKRFEELRAHGTGGFGLSSFHERLAPRFQALIARNVTAWGLGLIFDGTQTDGAFLCFVIKQLRRTFLLCLRWSHGLTWQDSKREKIICNAQKMGTNYSSYLRARNV